MLELYINEMLIKNEVGSEDKAYEISHAGKGQSGYSFGQCQWDLSKDPSINGDPNNKASDLFEDILGTATDVDGKLIFDTNKDGQIDDTEQAEITTITTKVQTQGGILDSTQKNLVNQALQSDEGYNRINSEYNDYLDNKLTRFNNLLGELDASGAKGQATADSIRNNQILQLLILDFDNKFHIDGINTPGNYTTSGDGALMKLLKNGETTINGQTVKVDGDFDVEDFLEFLFKTKEANKIDGSYSGAKDLLRRLAAIIDLTETKYGLTEEEWKTVDGLLGLKALGLKAKDLIAKIRSIFNAGENTGLQSSPIILDLDKDGVETTALNNGTYFDHDANGFAEQTGWASSDDGLLVMDRDNDGLIEDGTELFGDNTILANGTNASNGFQALSELDTNTDGKIDSSDAAYSQLRVWQDTDEDGYTSEGELKTLDELGIQSINTFRFQTISR